MSGVPSRAASRGERLSRPCPLSVKPIPAKYQGSLGRLVRLSWSVAEGFGELEQALSHPLVLDLVEGAGELEDLALRQLLAVERLLAVGEAALPAGGLARHVVEEE